MPARRTPWANTLRITGPIFIQDPSQSKLPQVAGYVVGVPGLRRRRGPLVFETRN
jgi:hypothetical protein